MSQRGRIDLGVGVGLRVPHYRHILDTSPNVDFFEIISENFMVDGGKPRYHLDCVLERYPVVQHGVSLGIGGPAAPDRAYLEKLRKLVRRVQPAWLSDHFCWCGAGGAHLHDLLPLPYCEEAVRRLVERAKQVQDFLEVPFALENTSSYLTYTASSMTEWDFITEVAERANIGLLLDVNNVYVSAYNHGFDPLEFVRKVPHERILQIHLAGHTNMGTHIIDTHRGQVIDDVWRLYQHTINLAGSVSTLIEWDDEIPEFALVQAEAEKARRMRDDALAGAQAPVPPDNGAFPAEGSVLGQSTPHAAAVTWKQGGPRESAAHE